MDNLEKAEKLESLGFSRVFGYEGYWARQDGQIASSRNREKVEPRMLVPLVINSGYKTVLFQLGSGKEKRITVHRVIALTFIPNPTNLACIDHLDADKENNSVSNLEWVSAKENVGRCIARGDFNTARGEDAGKSKLTEHQVREIHSLMSSGVDVSEIGLRYSVKSNAIYSIANGKSWEHLSLEPINRGVALGSRNKSSVLSACDVIKIRALLATGVKAVDVANQFKVTGSCIRHIEKERSWKHIA